MKVESRRDKSRFKTVEQIEKGVQQVLNKNELVPFSKRRKGLEEMLEQVREGDPLGGFGKDTFDESNFRFPGEEGMNLIVTNADRELKRYDSDSSIGIADWANVHDSVRRSVKTLETKDVDKEAQKGSKDGILNLDNLDSSVSKLLTGKRVEEIKLEVRDDFRVELKSKTTLAQIKQRAEVLAKLFVLHNQDDYKTLIQERTAALSKGDTMMEN